MFLTIQIRGPVQLVRRRTGEEVSNPILEFEDGGAHEDFDTTFDMRHRVIGPNPTDLESLEVASELEVDGTDEQLIAATSAFSGQDHSDQQRDLQSHQEHRRRAGLDRPLKLRRLLSRMHELSMLSRPVKQTFVQHLDTGKAEATLCVWRGELTIAASIRSFTAGASHRVRGSMAVGAGARLQGEGLLAPDGSIDRLRLDVMLDRLPALGPLEQAELSRLKTTLIEIGEPGARDAHQARAANAHFAPARRRPELPLLLLVALLDDLEQRAMGLLGGARPASTATMVTLHDLLASATETHRTSTQEVDLEAQTRLTWFDDNTPSLEVPGITRDRLDAVNVAFRRILTYLPLAWSGQVPVPLRAAD